MTSAISSHLITIAVAAAVLPGSVHAADRVPVSAFKSDGLNGWEAKSFKGETRYSIEDTARGPALKAVSNGTASGL